MSGRFPHRYYLFILDSEVLRMKNKNDQTKSSPVSELRILQLFANILPHWDATSQHRKQKPWQQWHLPG